MRSVVATLAIACLISSFFPLASQTEPPAPGQLVDIGGWRMHINCSGDARVGQPTVILEAGSSDFSIDWAFVQPEVAMFTRVCSYDRSGSGWSELGPYPKTLQQTVFELHTLLEKLLEEISFEGSELSEKHQLIDEPYVESRLSSLIKDQDLRQYIL